MPAPPFSTEEDDAQLPPPPFTMEMWADEAAVASEAAALEQALNSQLSQVLHPFTPLLCCLFHHGFAPCTSCVSYVTPPQGTMESILWGFNRGAGPRPLPGAVGTGDALPILASRPHLDRFLSSARALDLLRPVRDSVKRDMRLDGGAGSAMPQWGTGLPGEDRVLQMQPGRYGGGGRSDGDDDGVEGGGDGREGEAVGWGY